MDKEELVYETGRLVKEFEKTGFPLDACKDFVFYLVTTFEEKFKENTDEGVDILKALQNEWDKRYKEFWRN